MTTERSHGPKNEELVRLLLEVLLDIGEGRFDDKLNIHYIKNWKSSDEKLRIQTTVEALQSVIEDCHYLDKLKQEDNLKDLDNLKDSKKLKNKIGVLIKYLEEDVKIAKDDRVVKQGSDVRIWTMNLPSEDKEENLKYFDQIWNEKYRDKTSKNSKKQSQQSVNDHKDPEETSENSKKQSQQSVNADRMSLESGIYTLECLGTLRDEGEQFFLYGIPEDGRVTLPKLERNFSRARNISGAIWEITYDIYKHIYKLKCLGQIEGEQFFLYSIPEDGRVTLLPRPEGIDTEDVLSGTMEWEVFSVPNKSGVFKFKCRSSKKSFWYLDGRTLNKTVGLLKPEYRGRSGTKWKVELVPDTVLQKLGLKNLELVH